MTDTFTEPVLNEAKLTEILDFITDRPERHQQGAWLNMGNISPLDLAQQGWQCHTAGCVAGWTALRNGWVPAPSLEYNGETQKYELGRYLYDSTVIRAKDLAQLLADGGRDDYPEEWGVSKVAAEILGLTEWQARTMFAAHNSLQELWGYANQWSDGRIEIPRERIAAYEQAKAEQLLADHHRAADDTDPDIED